MFAATGDVAGSTSPPKLGDGQEITSVQAAEERKAGEIVEDEGDAHERIIQFLEQLKVI